MAVLPHFGYSVDKDLHYIINEQEASIIRLIFDMYKSNRSYVEICSELNLRGYKTRRGKTFAKNSIHDILTNEKYIGNYTFGYGNRAKKRGQPNPDMIKIEGGMPAIIDKELFYKIQEKMKGRKRMGGSYKAQQVYILSGLLKCGICGEKYVGAKKNPSWTVYECSGHKKGICDNKAIKKSEIEQVVIDKLKEKLNHLFNNSELLDKVNAKYKELYDNAENDLKNEEMKLANIQKQISNINKAVISGLYSPEMNEEMELLQKEKTVIEQSIEIIKNVSKKANVDSSDINKILSTSLLKLESDNEENIKDIVQKFVKEVKITPENINIKVVFDDTNVTGDNHGGGEENRTPVQ